MGISNQHAYFLKKFIIILFIFFVVCILCSVVYADENFIVNIGENKTFTEYNIHDTQYMLGSTTTPPLPLPDLTANSSW